MREDQVLKYILSHLDKSIAPINSSHDTTWQIPIII